MLSPDTITEHIPIIASIGALSAILFLALLMRPRWALGAIFLSVAAGQLIRIPLMGQGGGILVSDIALAMCIISTVTSVLFGRISTYSALRAFKMYCAFLLPFFVFSLAILLFHERSLGLQSFGIAFLYWARLFEISLLFPILLVFGYMNNGKKLLQRSFSATYYLLLGLGYAQLALFPSLVGNVNGWDPHIHRMVATWFDPNFFGAFIVIGMFPVVCWSRVKFPAFLFACGALLLTSSRSSWIAFAVACIVIVSIALLTSSLHKSWKNALQIFFILFVLCAVLVTTVFSSRVTKLFTHDPTAMLRTQAYTQVWHRLVEPNIFFGVGYNAYQFSAKKVGLIEDFSIHSRAGSDNSIITLLVTTGIIGTFLFLLPIFIGVYWHTAQWILHRRKDSLLFIWSASALVVHSQFENSLLYPHLLIQFLIISALSIL